MSFPAGASEASARRKSCRNTPRLNWYMWLSALSWRMMKYMAAPREAMGRYTCVAHA